MIRALFALAAFVALSARALVAQVPVCQTDAGVVTTADSTYTTTVTRCPVVVRIERDTVYDTTFVPIPDTTIPTPPPPRFSNEPAGFTVLSSNPLDAVPPYKSAPMTGAVGNWWRYPDTARSLSAVTDAQRGKVLEIQLRSGLPGGDSPQGKYGSWPSGKVVKKVYLRAWVKIEGADYENQKVLTKVMFLGYGNWATWNSSSFIGIGGIGGVQTIRSCFPIVFWQQNYTGARNLNTHGTICAGKWQLWEAVFETNTPGKADGKMTWWFDGVKTTTQTDILFYEAGFKGWQTAIVWGGTGGAKTRRDALRFDDVYFSGSN